MSIQLHDRTNVSDNTNEEEPVILFVSGTITYDSLTNTHDIKISQQKKFSGKLNLDRSEDIKESKGLNYVQLDANDQQLSRHIIENPLIQKIEYPDGKEFKMKTIIKQKAELYLRLQLNPRARKLQFCNDQEIIETIIINPFSIKQ